MRQIIRFLAIFIFIFPSLTLGVQETLTGKFIFNDGYEGDLESDLEISLNIDFKYTI